MHSHLGHGECEEGDFLTPLFVFPHGWREPDTLHFTTFTRAIEGPQGLSNGVYFIKT